MKRILMITLGINAGIACLDRANEVEPRPNEERDVYNRMQALTLHSGQTPRSLRSRRVDEWTNAKPRRGEMCITDGEAQRNRRYNKWINAGIACLDRANEVEPRPNEENNFAVCKAVVVETHGRASLRLTRRSLEATPSGRFSRASFAMTVRGYVFNPVNLVNPINHGSDNMLDWLHRAPLRFGCFAESVPNKVWGLAMTVLFGRFCVFSRSLARRIVSTTENNQRNRINQTNHSSDIQFITHN
jgi:hypothetical protein